MVAFGDDQSASVRKKIARCETKQQLLDFCESQPRESLIFVLDQFNGVQDDSTTQGSYRGSHQEAVRDFLQQVWQPPSPYFCVPPY
jgi:hypothetical protein